MTSIFGMEVHLRTFLSVSTLHRQWPAPMGSWWVWNCTALNLYQKQISWQKVWSNIIFSPPTFLGMGLSLSLILHPPPLDLWFNLQNKIITLKIAIVISDRLRHWLVSPSDCLIEDVLLKPWTQHTLIKFYLSNSNDNVRHGPKPGCQEAEAEVQFCTSTYDPC